MTRKEPTLNFPEIVGFPEPRTQTSVADDVPTRFELLEQLQQTREAELVRVIDIADKIARRFGPETAAGFLFYEILGRPPGPTECAQYGDRLRRAPSSARLVIEELLAICETQTRTAL
jgi:hypothetical protein